MSNKFSRRSFLKTTAAGAAGALAVTLLDRASFPRVARAAQKRTLSVGVIPGSPAAHMQDAAKKYMADHADVDIQVNVASGARLIGNPISRRLWPPATGQTLPGFG